MNTNPQFVFVFRGASGQVQHGYGFFEQAALADLRARSEFFSKDFENAQAEGTWERPRYGVFRRENGVETLVEDEGWTYDQAEAAQWAASMNKAHQTATVRFRAMRIAK